MAKEISAPISTQSTGTNHRLERTFVYAFYSVIFIARLQMADGLEPDTDGIRHIPLGWRPAPVSHGVAASRPRGARATARTPRQRQRDNDRPAGAADLRGEVDDVRADDRRIGPIRTLQPLSVSRIA